MAAGRWRNASTGYGSATKALHWVMAALFLTQCALAWTMVRVDAHGAVLGFTQAALYNWHKSLGLMLFGLAALRVANRRQGQLPNWAPSLSVFEHRLIHRYEQALYVVMFVLPISGFVYVMAGGFGVHLFGLWHLPNPLPESPILASVAKWTHILSAYALITALALHIGLVLRHTLILRDGLLRRML